MVRTPPKVSVLESATPGQRLLCGYYVYWDDVTNGGHVQYFGNYTGNLWQEALQATRLLRLPEERILRGAITLFPDSQPGRTQRERRPRLAKIDPARFDELDNRFYDAPSSDEKIRKYIQSHAEEFFRPNRT